MPAKVIENIRIKTVDNQTGNHTQSKYFHDIFSQQRLAYKELGTNFEPYHFTFLYLWSLFFKTEKKKKQHKRITNLGSFNSKKNKFTLVKFSNLKYTNDIEY